VTAHLPDLLTRAAAESPEREALVEVDGRRVTWAQLHTEVEAVAHGFHAQGLVPGHRVLIAVGNRTEFVTSYLGALRARLVAVPVNPRSTTGEMVRMLADSGARLVVADEGTVTTVRQAVAGLQDALVGADEELRRGHEPPRMVTVGTTALPHETSYDALLAERGSEALDLPVDPESLAALLYTSGTSGTPRAAMLSHRALLANIEQVAAVDPPMITGDDVVLGVLPLFHVYGLNAVLGQVVRHGARLVLMDGSGPERRFDAERSLAVVGQEAVSVVPLVPTVLAYWMSVPDLGDRLRTVRLVLSGSAPLPPELLAGFTDRTGISVHEGYGLTEAAPVVTSTLLSEKRKPGSVGAALPGVEIRLVDELGRAPEGEDAGEIQVRGDNLFSGYWPDGVDGPDGAGWYATGDVGFLDADGDLFLVDRLKELVIVSGFNVYPVEVEEVITELEAVAEAAVIGAEDEVTGEAVVAYVRRSASSSLTDEDLARDVAEHCAVRLARFKQPARVHVVDQLPHTVTGKVAKGRLRAHQRRSNLGLLE
jgi:long-chain acyl-CoA synthetase